MEAKTQGNTGAEPHIIIAGTGRAGTSFLMQLLTKLEFDTGFKDIHERWDFRGDGGLEWDLQSGDWPRIVKNPLASQCIGKLAAARRIEHVYVPFRNLEDAARSRVIRRVPWCEGQKNWTTKQVQEFLQGVYGKLIADLEQSKIPYSVVHFPRLTEDPEYLWKAMPLFQERSYEEFHEAFASISRNYPAIAEGGKA